LSQLTYEPLQEGLLRQF